MSNAIATTQNGNAQVETETPRRESEEFHFTPRFDFWDGEHEWRLFGDLPGVTIDNLEVHADHGQLTVHGHVSRPRQGKAQYVVQEYGVADFYRTFTIGDEIDVDNISADLSNGVLCIRLPKAEAVKPRRIQVKAG